jgi:hypothetical protein
LNGLPPPKVATELLTAPEYDHQIETAFVSGPVSIALESLDGDFIAQPVCRRLVDKIWLGGDWSLLEFKRFAACLATSGSFYRFICVEDTSMTGGDGEKHKGMDGAGLSAKQQQELAKLGRPKPHISTLTPLYREVAHPSKMRRVPCVQFLYETSLGLIFIALSINSIVHGSSTGDSESTAEELDADGSLKEQNMKVLIVFIAGNMLYEAGQVGHHPRRAPRCAPPPPLLATPRRALRRHACTLTVRPARSTTTASWVTLPTRGTGWISAST